MSGLPDLCFHRRFVYVRAAAMSDSTIAADTLRRSAIAQIDAEFVAIAAAQIWLHDEGSRRHWSVQLQPYRLNRYAVTQQQYHAVLGLAAPAPEQACKPVVEVSWYEAIAFCNALSRSSGVEPAYAVDEDGTVRWLPQADGYRLPSEAEWEHACRAGSTQARYGELDAIAWHAGNSAQQLHAVGTRDANAWGLYDMIGNAWEWCWDIFDAQIYGEYRVFRGGGWADDARACRAACRRKSHPTFRIDDLGFRLARAEAAGAAQAAASRRSG